MRVNKQTITTYKIEPGPSDTASIPGGTTFQVEVEAEVDGDEISILVEDRGFHENHRFLVEEWVVRGLRDIFDDIVREASRED